ncbi:hypothetical protein HDU86_000110 [Geranomyces michiganensis]|nr:hypothetical protein HDU86_000110 [Geranomyces michiganensis]
MAKGLRSKSMRKNRSALRATVFGPVEDARLARLVQKEIAALAVQDTSMAVEPPVSQASSEAGGRAGAAADEEEAKAGNEGEAMMEVDGGAPSSSATTESSKPMSKSEKEKLFLSRNAYKKKMKARAKAAGKKWSYAKQR